MVGLGTRIAELFVMWGIAELCPLCIHHCVSKISSTAAFKASNFISNPRSMHINVNFMLHTSLSAVN